MKLLLLAMLAVVSNTLLHAQKVKPDTKLLQRALAYKMNGTDMARRFLPRIKVVPGTRVQTLPQDNMPCIVPDTKELAAMPNVLLVKPMQPITGQIPNARKKRIQLQSKKEDELAKI